MEQIEKVRFLDNYSGHFTKTQPLPLFCHFV
jgi:hypothetical protein